MIPDAGYTCIREGDGYCDTRYESAHNSLDCRSTCKKEGESVSNGSLPPQYQYHGTCCSGLTEIGPKEEFIVGASNICANVGDGYCDTRYESIYNSADCRESSGFDSSICQSYYDGCNSCSKTENGQTLCTMRYCEVPDGPAYCTSYISYTPVSQAKDNVYIGKVLSEIRNYTKDLSCTIDTQCQVSMIGFKSCG